MRYLKKSRIAVLAVLVPMLPFLLAGSAAAESVSLEDPNDKDPGYESMARETQEAMDRLSFLIGDWEVAVIDENNQPQFQTTSKIRSILNGKVLEERAVAYWDDQAWDMVLMRSYDLNQKIYRMVAVDNIVGMIDVYEGTLEGDVLRESNLETGTFSSPASGKHVFFRNQMQRISDDHFVLETEYSSDAGRSWKAAGKFIYKRQS